MNKPTVDQQKIIDAGISNMLVSAGAGCGKSSVLTARIIKRIKEGKLSIKNLIVLSFTNASANDIRKKIKDALKKEISGNNKLADEYDYVEQSNISTFDSLCHNFFKKYAYKLNLKSDINILDGTQYSFILSNIINDVCVKYYDNPLMIKLLDLLTIRDDESFKDSLFGFYDSFVNNSVDSKIFLNEMIDITKNNISKTLDEYKNEKNEIINKIKMMYMDSFIDEDADILYRSYINPILEASNWESVEDFKLDLAGMPGRNRKPFSKKENGDFHLVFKPVLEEYLKYNLSIKELEENLNNTYNYSSLIKDICNDVIDEYEKYCYSHNAFTFNDVAKMVIKILKENNDVLEEIKNNITEIYVDEYQDTSNIQEELINLISNNNLIVVGDVKQSIYRFRNANPDIFKNKFEKYGKNDGGSRVDLKDNFRSRVEVLNEINSIFDLLMTNDFDGINYKDEHRLNPGNKSFTSSNPGLEFYHVITKEEVNDKLKSRKKSEINEETFERVLKDIKYKKDNDKSLKYSDFAVIVRNKNYFNNYCKIAEKYNVPLICETTKPFIRNIEIMVLNSIINYLITKEDIYKVSILRSFLFDVTDQEIVDYLNGNVSDNIKKIDELLLDTIFMKDYSTLYDLISFIYDKFEFFKNIYKLDDPIGAEKRLLYMLEVTNTYMSLGWTYKDMGEYLNLLNAPSIRELDISYDSNDNFNDDAINLITIHKSKGLEYKYIYFVETDSKVGKINDNTINYHSSLGLSIKPLLKQDYVNNKMKELNRLEQLYEDLRLLYVCLTRAKCGIIIFTASDKNSDNTKLLPYVSADIKKEYKTYDDMLMSAFESYKEEKDKDVIFDVKKEDKVGNEVIFDNLKIDSSLYNFERASHGISEIIDRKTALSLKHGTLMHKLLEDIDFDNPDFTDISEVNERRIKEFIGNLKALINEKPIKYYKEYDIKINDTFGQIDLLVETENRFIVIDYKAKEINKDYYDLQVKSYMKEITNKTNKQVSGYLYSIEDSEFKEVIF